MSSPFVGSWTITSWVPDTIEVPSGIPMDGVRNEGPLEITEDGEFFTLTWETHGAETASVSGLIHVPDSSPPMLSGHAFASFGDYQVLCDVTVGLTHEADPKELQCIMGKVEPASADNDVGKMAPDTGSGTFTAQATGGGTYARRP